MLKFLAKLFWNVLLLGGAIYGAVSHNLSPYWILVVTPLLSMPCPCEDADGQS